jgi:hypothetical protein
MKKIYFLICLLILPGCSIFQSREYSLIQPKLLQQTPLPPISSSIYKDKFEFKCNLLIDQFGNVERVIFLNNSGDATWDSLATISLLKWKFSPALFNNKPTKIMVRRNFIVLYEEPIVFPLSEIQFTNQSVADSAYQALLNGANFTDLVNKYSISPSRNNNGYLGAVNVKLYSKDISDILSKLSEDEFTEPIKYGESFVIFKRDRSKNY